jgi:hypothetical protein
MNVRSIFYQKVKRVDLPFDLYYFKNAELSSKPEINFYIADNWKYEEAYLMPELDSVFEPFTAARLSFTDTAADTWNSFQPNAYNKENFLKTAAFLSAAIESNGDIYLTKMAGDSILILRKENDREAIRIILKDYLKLTGKSK